MKKILSLWLFAALLVSALPVSGATVDAIEITQTKGEVTYTVETPGQPVFSIVNRSDHEVYVTVEVYDELMKQTMFATPYTLPVGTEPFLVYGFAYKHLERNDQINTYRYRVTTPNGVRETFYAAQTRHTDKATNQPYYVEVHNAYLPRNTVSSFGPQFRVLSPGLTKEWFMFTPINLGIQGRQTFTLVGSNMYEVGEVHVDVAGDMVTVSYNYFYEGMTEKIKRGDEFLHFFRDYSSVSTVDYKQLGNSFTYGRPFSIVNDLGGDTNVLMFVRNILSYYRFPMPDKMLSRNYPKSQARTAERGAMLAMMDPVPGMDLVNDHNYAN